MGDTVDNIRRAWPAQPIATVNGMPYTYGRMTIKVDGVTYGAKSLAPVRFGYQCRKCAGQKTRAHARKCPKRGLGHKGREAEARHVEALACEYGITRRVRRGRRDVGTSINQLRNDIVIAQSCPVLPPPSSFDLLQSVVPRFFGPNASFIVDNEKATIDITADKPTDEGLALVRDNMPAFYLVRVNGVSI